MYKEKIGKGKAGKFLDQLNKRLDKVEIELKESVNVITGGKKPKPSKRRAKKEFR